MASKIAEKILHYDFIIWDWNGTLLDDRWAAVEAENQQIKKYKIPAIDLDTRRKIFHHPIKSYYEKIGFDFTHVSYEEISREWLKLYESLIPEMKLFEGIKDLLGEIKTLKKKQFILSASPEDHLLENLKKFDVFHFFEKCYGLNNCYAYSKVQRGHDLLKEQKIDSSKTILIGDTDHDAEVAQEMGIDVLLVGDGHQCPSVWGDLTDNYLTSRY